MTRTDALWLLWIGLILLLGPAASLEGQSDAVLDPGKAAQAKSQEEFDKYLEIVVAADPHQVIGKVDAFVSEFPQSELLSAAYQYKMHACEKLNDFDGMLATGRKALLGNPDNVNILLAGPPAERTEINCFPRRRLTLISLSKNLRQLDSRGKSRSRNGRHRNIRCSLKRTVRSGLWPCKRKRTR